MVRLICGDQELIVSAKQAEAIMHVQHESKNISNWQLPEDSKYKLIDGKLIERGDTKVVQRPSRKKVH